MVRISHVIQEAHAVPLVWYPDGPKPTATVQNQPPPSRTGLVRWRGAGAQDFMGLDLSSALPFAEEQVRKELPGTSALPVGLPENLGWRAGMGWMAHVCSFAWKRFPATN